MFANDILQRDHKHYKPPNTQHSDAAGYAFLLCASRAARCAGVFVLSELLRSLHLLHLAFFIYLGTCLVVVPLQRPDALHRRDWSRVLPLALVGGLVDVLYFYGITQCGPLRSVVIFEQSPAAVLAAMAVIFKGGSSPAKVRATVLMAIGFLALVLMDKDISMHYHGEEHAVHQSGLYHVLHHVSHYFGLADHKLGVLLLLLAVCLQAAQSNAAKSASVTSGLGAKRLAAATLMCKLALAAPLAGVLGLWQTFSRSPSPPSAPHTWFECLILLILAAGLAYVVPFYVEVWCQAHMEPQRVARLGPVVSSVAAFAIAAWWFPAYKTAVPTTGAIGSDPHAPQIVEHRSSPGVMLSALMFAFATIVLTRADERRGRGAQFIGTDHTGKPLFVYAEDFLKAFCGVEFVYGVWTNSLGLISDGFHMLFDCSALVMGLAASVMANWTANKAFSYGYGRVEVLSGFVNALFLVVIAWAIFLNALGRLFDPPEIHTERLLIVSVAGLIVNIFGIMAFHGDHGHSHGGGGGHDHGHGHSHGGGSSHGHSHGGGANANMQGVFLHVLADTLGSVFVIISTLLISWFGWLWVDPLCSLILAALIFASVLPLLRQAAGVLLQQTPDELIDPLHVALDQVLRIDGVLSYASAHVWQLKSDYVAASLHVQVAADTSQQLISQQVRTILQRELGAQAIAVQVETEAFTQSVAALCHGYEPPPRIGKNPNDTVMSRAI